MKLVGGKRRIALFFAHIPERPEHLVVEHPEPFLWRQAARSVIEGERDARTLPGSALPDFLLLLPVMDHPEQGKRGIRDICQITLYKLVFAVPYLGAGQDELAFFRHDIHAVPDSDLIDDFGTAAWVQHQKMSPVVWGPHHRPGGASTILGSSIKTAARFAAFVNGVGMHADDYDDTQLAVAEDRVYGQYPGINHNLDQATRCASYPWKELAWDQAHCRYLMGLYYGTWPWLREFVNANRLGLPAIKLWAYDHLCLFGWPVPLPTSDDRSFIY